MKVGLVKEIKNQEGRVGMTPVGVKALTAAGHEVAVEVDAGLESGISNEEYVEAGAIMVNQTAQAWDVDLVVKVKEPQASEFHYFKEGLILFAGLHLATDSALMQAFIDKKVNSIGIETVQLDNGIMPILGPMSEVAGRRAAIVAATYLEKHRGGRGILLSGVPGTERGHVVVLGAGVAGLNAAKVALGVGARVTILNTSLGKLKYIDDTYPEIETLFSSEHNVAQSLLSADAVISTIASPGAKATKVIKEYMVKAMKPGSVIVDISSDQGGSSETIDRITTHDDPVYEKYGVIHYAVPNMPGATLKTATYALTNTTLPYIIALANKGMQACLDDSSLLRGLNTANGKITYQAVADAFNKECFNAKETVLEIV